MNRGNVGRVLAVLGLIGLCCLGGTGPLWLMLVCAAVFGLIAFVGFLWIDLYGENEVSE